MPALGKDLSKIRSHLGLTVQDIQHITKIPVSTLKSIENGAIFSHPEENQTYIRSFVRSYGRALKIDDDVMIKALDQNEAGNYTHLLLESFPALAPQVSTQPEQETETDTKPDEEIAPDKKISTDKKTGPDVQISPDEENHEQEFSFEKQETPEKDAVQKPQNEKKKPETTKSASPQNDVKPKVTDSSPSVKSVDWADVGRKFSQEKKHTPAWIVGLIIILIIAAFVAYFMYENGFFSSSNETQQEQMETQSSASQANLSLELEDSLAAGTSETGMDTAPLDETVVQEDDVLQLTVYAAYDGLGPVRVWSDIKPRMDPYWLEQGTAMHFEFSDTIRIRGVYENMLLFKDGNLIENSAQNFLQQETDYLELTRDFFESDGKWATSVDYELPEGTPPPDSIANRPTF